ncbi:MAG: penicillin-binding protein 2 [Gemmatimonadetes bacterium]|nr:penicillin-binding protein 2 [Gemmatimonadota bacterium]
MQFNTRIHQSRAQRLRRGAAARVLIILVGLFLLIPLYRLQILTAEQFALQARQNRMRPVVVRAPRGTIYDRQGRIVAENIVGYQVLLMPADIDTLRAQVARLQPVLGLDSADVVRAFRRYQRAPHLPMDVVRDASPESVARLEERRFLFPDVLVQEYPKRHYPAGPAIAHFIGYVSEISEAEMATPEFEGYDRGRWIGKAGLEAFYEKRLGGEPGVRYLEIDARGRIKQWLPEEFGQPAIPGDDLHLYLDLDLQEYIAHIFPKEFTGAFVAIDPRTGGILAAYSHPSYDPNDFIGGIPIDLWDRLLNDPARPLLDRVAGSGQPAASTWKLAVAAMALDVGAISPEEYMPMACSGGMSYGNRYWQCWEPRGHGRMNLIEGIKNSCNVYFYQVGLRIGLDRFLETGIRLGFDQRTGVDIPSELKPTFPESRDYWTRRFGYPAQEGEVLSMAIGQGPIIMTALKLAHFYTALARNDGRVPAPRFARDAGEPPDTLDVATDPRDVWYLDAGMRRVVAPGGTAGLSRLRDWDFIGKTGTAQNPHGPTHGWFIGLGGPRDGEPEIAVTMFLEFAQHGYIASGYVAEAINFYLDRKYARPFQGWATPRHRLARGLPINWNWNEPIVDPPMPGSTASAAATDSASGAAANGDANRTATRPDTTTSR